MTTLTDGQINLMTGKRQPGAAARAAIQEETDLDWDDLFEIVRTVEVQA